MAIQAKEKKAQHTTNTRETDLLLCGSSFTRCGRKRQYHPRPNRVWSLESCGGKFEVGPETTWPETQNRML